MNDSTDALLRRAADGDSAATDALFQEHRRALERMVHLRLDRALRRRLDVSDVVQEALLEASRRLARYLADGAEIPFAIWLRLVTGQKLAELRRRHLGSLRRDAALEVETRMGSRPSVPSRPWAERVARCATSPSGLAVRAEAREQVIRALERLDARDREVLVMRHFERRSNTEVALELGLRPEAASKRHVRALERLRRQLETAGVTG
jgi:RNA polymerase sigma-70 factor (ECF subfamily)